MISTLQLYNLDKPIGRTFGDGQADCLLAAGH